MIQTPYITEWEYTGTNADGKIRHYEFLEEAFNDLHKVVQEYRLNKSVLKVFIDRWEQKKNEPGEPITDFHTQFRYIT